MEKILENDFKQGMLKLIDNYIDAYSDMIVNAIFCGDGLEVSAFVGGSFALRKLREDVVDGKYDYEDKLDIEDFEEVFKELFNDED